MHKIILSIVATIGIIASGQSFGAPAISVAQFNTESLMALNMKMVEFAPLCTGTTGTVVFGPDSIDLYQDESRRATVSKYLAQGGAGDGALLILCKYPKNEFHEDIYIPLMGWVKDGRVFCAMQADRKTECVPIADLGEKTGVPIASNAPMMKLSTETILALNARARELEKICRLENKDKPNGKVFISGADLSRYRAAKNKIDGYLTQVKATPAALPIICQFSDNKYVEAAVWAKDDGKICHVIDVGNQPICH